MPVPRITRVELTARLDHPNPDSRPLLLDVRLTYAFEHRNWSDGHDSLADTVAATAALGYAYGSDRPLAERRVQPSTLRSRCTAAARRLRGRSSAHRTGLRHCLDPA